MKLRGRQRGGFTLIEAGASVALVGGLVVLSVLAVQSASGPLISTTTRADLTNRGTDLLSKLTVELEGSSGHEVGTFDLGTGTFTPDATNSGETGAAATDEVDNDGDGLVDEEEYHGRAVRFYEVEWDVANEEVAVSPDALIFAFVIETGEILDNKDNDGDNLIDELRLIRYRASDGFTATLAREIANDVTGSDPPGAPRFHLISPATLEIEFTFANVTGFDTRAQTLETLEVDFAQRVNLRNLNQ